MSRIISALLLGLWSAVAFAQGTPPIRLAPDAPDRHVVQKGDTLWAIAGKFLQEPWRWPEIWRLNRDQIRNPHRIYPGQVVVLDRRDGQPRLVLGEPVKLQPKVYEESSLTPIPSIPSQVIEPFLSEPLIVEQDGLAKAPKIIATQESRVFLGPGNVAYVTGLTPSVRLWQVYRPARPIEDPVTSEVLGHEAVFLGTAQVVAAGEPATVEIITAKQEIGAGDRLVPLERPDLVIYAPHSPDREINGRVVSIYDGVGVGETGRNYVVALNRGKLDGLEVGHVLALHRGSVEVSYWDGGATETHTLPHERFGLVFVFRTFDRLSYALVMNSSRPVMPKDIVRKP